MFLIAKRGISSQESPYMGEWVLIVKKLGIISRRVRIKITIRIGNYR